MEEWVARALQRWPNVPALYGWLKLDRRGRWLIKGETIGRERIVEVIDRNYAADERGCWFFQNGPQRGYMQLETAPFVLRVVDAGILETHNLLRVRSVQEAFMNEHGGLYLNTEHGAGALLDTDMEWALTRMRVRDREIDEAELGRALALSTGTATDIDIAFGETSLRVTRLDDRDAPDRLRFVRDPRP